MAKAQSKEQKKTLDEKVEKPAKTEKPLKADKHDDKDKKALVGQVRKVVKKSRRKLGEEKFEKELQRTILFLTELRDRLGDTPAKPAAGNGKAKATAKPAAAAKAAKPAKTKPAAALPVAAAGAAAAPSAKASAKTKATK